MLVGYHDVLFITPRVVFFLVKHGLRVARSDMVRYHQTMVPGLCTIVEAREKTGQFFLAFKRSVNRCKCLESWLVGALEHFLFFHILGISIPIDYIIFFRWFETTNQLELCDKFSLPLVDAVSLSLFLTRVGWFLCMFVHDSTCLYEIADKTDVSSGCFFFPADACRTLIFIAAM